MTEDLPESPAQRETGGHPGWTEQLVELAVFLVIILPPMAISFYVFFFKTQTPWDFRVWDFRLFAISSIFHNIGLVGLIFFFLWRNGEPFQSLGWNFKNGWRDIGLGLLIFLPLIFGIVVLDIVLKAAGLTAPLETLPSFLAASAKVKKELLLAFLFVVDTALAEEIIFRGYLILRFKAITASPAAAVLLSAAIFALGHGWKGAAGVVTMGFVGLFYGLVYLRRQSLVAPMIMHFLQDIGIVLIPLFGIKVT